jgi:ABC-type uncharacterized transport system substrate-binding protein
MGGKWLELLKEIAPSVKRAAMIFNPDTAPGRGSHYLPSFEAAARSFRVEPITEPVHNEVEIETVVTRLGHKPESGLVVIGDSFLVSHRKPIILAAAENKVPAVYFQTQSQTELARQQFQRSAQQQVRVLPNLPIEPRIIMRVHAALESFGRF